MTRVDERQRGPAAPHLETVLPAAPVSRLRLLDEGAAASEASPTATSRPPRRRR